MKKNKIFSLIFASLALVFASCEPIVENDSLSNTTDVNGVELLVTQSGNNGNLVELKMNTPGVTGYWDYNIGRAFTDRVEFIYPIPGTHTFTFTGTLGKEFFTKTIEVQIDELDNALPQEYTFLVSENTAAGKTWVFAAQPWVMSPPDDIQNGYNTTWWPAFECCLADPTGSMKFDLDGAANYTYYNNPTAVGQVGSFALSIPNKTLKFEGAPILGGQAAERLPADGVFNIVLLTETEMILYTPRTAAGDSGWTWRFVAVN